MPGLSMRNQGRYFMKSSGTGRPSSRVTLQFLQIVLLGSFTVKKKKKSTNSYSNCFINYNTIKGSLWYVDGSVQDCSISIALDYKNLLHLDVVDRSDTTSERKARKLGRHSQFCERSSPAVKARAPTSTTTKLWSNHEQTTTFHLSQLLNNPSNPTFVQHFLFQ